MCCLKYEQEHYEQARKQLPRVGRDVMTPNGRAHVLDINVLKETVRVRMLEDENTEVVEFRAADVQRLPTPEPEKKKTKREEKADRGKKEAQRADAETEKDETGPAETPPEPAETPDSEA